MARILVVEDYKLLAKLIKKMISESLSIDALTCSDSAEAIGIINGCAPAQHFDLIITDLRMLPKKGVGANRSRDGKEGLAVLEAARKKSLYTKVVFLSAFMTKEDRQEAPAEGYLRKPQDVGEPLVKLVKNLIEDHLKWAKA